VRAPQHHTVENAAPECVLPESARRSARVVAEVPRLALTVEEACQALGVGWDFWSEHVAPFVPLVRRGRRKLVPVDALRAWLEAEAQLALSAQELGAADEVHPGGRRNACKSKGARQPRASGTVS